MTKKNKKLFIIDILLIIVLAVAIGISMAYSREIELRLGLCYYINAEGERVEMDDKQAVARAEENGELKVHFVNVRQGDCIIIELPDGKNMIIDGADKKSHHRTAVMEFIDKTLPDLVYFDYAILTHADADHCGSLDDVLNKYPAYTVYRPNVLLKRDDYTDPAEAELLPYYGTAITAAYRDFLEAAYTPTAPHDFTPNVIVTDATDDSQTIKGGEGDNAYSLTFYSPLYSEGKKYSDANDYSSIMMFEYRGFKFMLSGDAEEKNEEEFVAKVNSAKTDGVTDKYDVFDDSFNADVIKAGHHGSDTSNTQGYLDTVTTENGAASSYYVFSCDKTDGNDYDHPKQEVLDRLSAMGVPESHMLRTDIVGDITFSVRAENGEYMLYYGDAATQPTTPDQPEQPTTPTDPTEPEQPTEPEPTLEYLHLGGIKLTWAVVAWTIYAVVVVILLLHILYLYRHGRGKNK